MIHDDDYHGGYGGYNNVRALLTKNWTTMTTTKKKKNWMTMTSHDRSDALHDCDGNGDHDILRCYYRCRILNQLFVLHCDCEYESVVHIP